MYEAYELYSHCRCREAIWLWQQGEPGLRPCQECRYQDAGSWLIITSLPTCVHWRITAAGALPSSIPDPGAAQTDPYPRSLLSHGPPPPVQAPTKGAYSSKRLRRINRQWQRAQGRWQRRHAAPQDHQAAAVSSMDWAISLALLGMLVLQGVSLPAPVRSKHFLVVVSLCGALTCSLAQARSPVKVSCMFARRMPALRLSSGVQRPLCTCRCRSLSRQ